jgi:signal transduction histidine kinase
VKRLLSTTRAAMLFILGLIILAAAGLGFIWLELWSFVIILGVVVIGLFWFIFRGQSEGKNSAIISMTIIFSGIVGLFAFVEAIKKPIPISTEGFWLLIELGLIAFLLALALLFMELEVQGLERTSRDHGNLLESYNKLEYHVREVDKLIEAMSDSELQALKHKHKSDERVVEIIDDILEERE